MIQSARLKGFIAPPTSSTTASGGRVSMMRCALASSMEAAQSMAPSWRVAELWYHTLDLPGGVVTPGWMDMRPVVERLPWADVRGTRCLHGGPYAAFLC